jgi:hypothetical protein
MRRDHRRIWFLGIVCVFAWMLVVMLPWATVLPMLGKIAKAAAADDTGSSPSQQALKMHLAQGISEGIVFTVFESLASMFVAAICTVSLIILSRRATLRQVNARLAEISAQLRAMAGGPR